jgi:glyoxylase-like metal-dependent hydrolase (beta-lactamase superfamily II)
MHIPRHVVPSATIVLFLLLSRLALAAPNEVLIIELATGVYFRKAQTSPVFTGCNQGWVEFRDFVLVIDANFPGQVKEIVKEIRARTDKPIRFVFDTHYHGDHADGNMRYTELGATPIANERSKALFESKGRAGFEQALRDRKDEYDGLIYAEPALYFGDKLVIDDGTQRVELLYFGHAHTLGDAVAWLPQHGILFTGDACVNGAFNYTGDSNTEGWIAVLAALQELPCTTVAPGHGELSDNSLLEKQKSYFVQLRSEVKKGIDKGYVLDEIKQTIRIPSYKEWTGVDVQQNVENIEHVYKELTGGISPAGK